MQSYGPGPPINDHRFVSNDNGGDGSMTPSRFLNHFEGGWVNQPTDNGFQQQQNMPFIQQPQMVPNYRPRQNEVNPFEKSFDPNDMNVAMSRSSSVNDISMYQNLIDDYHTRHVAPKRALSPTYEAKEPTEQKRPKHAVIQDASKHFSHASVSHPSSYMSKSSFESVQSTAADSSDDQMKSRSPRSTTSEETHNFDSRKNSFANQESRKNSLANQEMQAQLSQNGMPLNFENMSQLKFGRLAQGFAQLNNQVHVQPAPRAIPANGNLSASAPPNQMIHAPHPFRPEPIASHLQHMHDMSSVLTPQKAPLTGKAKKAANHKRRSSSQRHVEEDIMGGHADQSGNDNEDGKRAQFLERNRLAACRSRQKKKEWIKSLEHSAEDMSTRNSDLETANIQLTEQLSKMQAMIVASQSCECGSAQSLYAQLSAQGLMAGAPTSPATKYADIAVPTSKRQLAPPTMDFSMTPYDDFNFDGHGFNLPTSVLDTPELARESAFASTIV